MSAPSQEHASPNGAEGEAPSRGRPRRDAESYLAALGKTAPALSDLARVYSLRNSTDEDDRELAKEYPVLVARFLRAYRISSWHISENIDLAVATNGKSAIYHSHSTAVATVADARWLTCFQECQSLANEAANVLRERSLAIAVGRLYRVQMLLTVTLDSLAGNPDDARERAKMESILEHAEKELKGIRKFLEEMVNQAEYRLAHQAYLFGMVPGVLVVVALAVLINYLDLVGDETPGLVAAIAAGAIGALLSVMSRTTKARYNHSLSVDYQIGMPLIFSAGLFRPLVGAILGGSVYMLIQSGILPIQSPEPARELYVFASVGLLAGFSERLAQDALVQTSRSIFSRGSRGPSSPNPGGDPSPSAGGLAP